MKKSFLLFSVLLIVCFLFSGCVIKREQFVKNQIYTCTKHPALKLQIEEDLKYMGNFTNNKTISNPDFSDTADYETHLFADSEDGEINKALLFISRQFNDDNSYTYLACSRVNKNKVFINEYIKDGFEQQCRIVGLVNPSTNYRYLGVDLKDGHHNEFSGNYIYESVSRVAAGGSIFYQIIYLEQVKSAIGISFSSSFYNFDIENFTEEEKKSFDEFLVDAKNAYKKLPK